MTMKCPQCDFENEEGSKFCKNCSEPLVKFKIPNAIENPYIKIKEEDQPFELISDDEDEEDKIRKKIEKEEEIRAEVRTKIEREKKKSSSGKGCLVFLVLAIIIGFFMFKSSPPTKKVSLITPEIKQEIKALEGEPKNDLFTFTDIEEGDDSITVKMKLLFEPKSKDEVQFLTDLACGACYKILTDHGINYFIYVWGYKPTEKEGYIKMYGETSYDKYSSKLTFESKMK
jgi:hypothetical protein